MKRATEKQRAWLEHLRDSNPSTYARRGTTAYSCRKAGWFEWMIRDLATDEILPQSEADKRLGEHDLPFQRYVYMSSLETITDAGRAVLASLPTPLTSRRAGDV